MDIIFKVETDKLSNQLGLHRLVVPTGRLDRTDMCTVEATDCKRYTGSLV